jgi:hypothetical protein
MPVIVVASTNNGCADVSMPIAVVAAVSNGRLMSACPLLLFDHNSDEIVVVSSLPIATVSYGYIAY